MLDLRRVLHNATSATAMRVASMGLSFAMFTFLARRWGDVRLGEFATLFAIFTLLQRAPLLGLHIPFAREVAARPEGRTRHVVNSTLLSLAVSVVLAVVVALGGAALYPPHMRAAIGLLGLTMIPTGVIVVAESLLWGEERLGVVMTINVVENVVRVAGVVAVVLAGHGLTAVWACILLGRLVMVAAYLGAGGLGRILDPRAVDPRLLRDYLVMSPTFLGMLLLSTSINRIDFLILSKLGGLRDVGLYSSAYKINEMLLMAPTILSVVLFPVFSRLAASPGEGLETLVRRTFRMYFVAGAPLVLLLAAGAEPIIRLIYGPAYAPAAILLCALIAVPVLAGLDQVLTAVLLARGRQTDDLKVLAISCGLYVALLFALIPRLGALGAALATLVTAIAQLVTRYVVTRRGAGVPPLIGSLARPAAAAAAMAAALALLGGRSLVLAAVVALPVYVAAVALLGVVTRRDVIDLRAALTTTGGGGR